jgi:nucleoside-diphosphate-sugar epimerase
MRVLAIGGTGFVGSRAVTRLSRLGHEVVVAHRGQTESDLPAEVRHLHHPALDLVSDRYVVDAIDELRKVEPAIVLHLNPATELDAGAVMAAFAGLARRVVAISSMDVYRAYGRMHRTEPGPPDSVPLGEDAPLRESFYTDRLFFPGSRAEKILAERVILGKPRLPGTVLRWPMVYGPRDRQRRLRRYLQQMDDGRPVILLDERLAAWRASRGFTENVALAVVLAVTDERAAGRVYNVGETEAPSEAEWVQQIGRAAGWAGEVIVVPRDQSPPHLVPGHDTDQDWVVDTSRIRAELGYAEEVPRDEALHRTIAWERAHPPSEPITPEADVRARYAAEDALLASPRRM